MRLKDPVLAEESFMTGGEVQEFVLWKLKDPVEAERDPVEAEGS